MLRRLGRPDHKVEAVRCVQGSFRRCRRGPASAVCPAGAFPRSSSFPAWTASRKYRWRSTATAGPGIAVLAIDGPGQYRGADGRDQCQHGDSGLRPGKSRSLSHSADIDADRIGVTGTSFGSFFGTLVAASEPRLCRPRRHLHLPAHLKGPPSRSASCQGFTDEKKFNKFCRTLTWEGHIDKIRCPLSVRCRRGRGAFAARIRRAPGAGAADSWSIRIRAARAQRIRAKYRSVSACPARRLARRAARRQAVRGASAGLANGQSRRRRIRSRSRGASFDYALRAPLRMRRFRLKLRKSSS